MGNTVRIRNGMSNATEGDILGSMGDIVKTLGVVDLAGGHLLVTADTPTGMTVQVAGGIVYAPNSNYDELDSDTPKFYPVVCDSEVVTIDNNVSGSTRIDIVCVKVDKAIAPNADADNIATKVVIKGTPGGGTPSTPANHYKLAEITVVNGETAIENSMITDKREQVVFDKRYTTITALDALTDGASDDLLAIVDVSDNNVGEGAMSVDGTDKKITLENLAHSLLDWTYPIGTIYETTSSDLDTTTKMNAHFGGTWEVYGSGRVLVAKSTDAEFDTIGETGGAKTHTLTTSEMPSHSHANPANSIGYINALASLNGTQVGNLPTPISGNVMGQASIPSAGGGGSHNNLQPYIVVFRYRRVS